MQSQEQLKLFTQMKEAEHQSLFKQIKKQEKLLEEVHREKRGMLLFTFFVNKRKKEFQNPTNYNSYVTFRFIN